MTERQKFLEIYWERYPAAQPGWIDVDEFLKTNAAAAVVCGRIRHKEGESWSLSSAGKEIEILLKKDARWMSPLRVEGDPSAPTVQSVLKDHDLVALELTGIGNNSWIVSRCALLAPALSPKPARPAIDVNRSRLWMEFIDFVRLFFRERGFIEALTPTLVPSPGTEPFLDAFETDVIFEGERKGTYYLPTSPEFHLKKMLAAGWTKIFEIKTCFRNGEAGAHHQLEFQMLEWYRAYSTLDAIADDVEGLINALVRRFYNDAGELVLERTTISELFSRAFPGFVLKPETTREELADLAEKNDVRILESDTWDEIFFRLFLEKIEPGLGKDAPVLVRDYPPSQAALSRIGCNGFADRFEIYWRGLEIANAFHELNDPEENVERFQRDAEVKKTLGKPAFPVDEELVDSLRFGMPPSGGIALGLDRLFMALMQVDSIEETRAFPFKNHYYRRGPG